MHQEQYMKYTSANFQIHYLSSYTLLVKTDFIHDTLIVLDKEREIQVFHIYPSNEPDGDAMKLLGLPFQNVYVMLPSQSTVFIPEEVFRAEELDTYQAFLLDENKNRTEIHTLDNMNITACYQYDMLLHNRWKNIFPNAVFFTPFQAVLGQIQTHVPLQGTVLGVHFTDVQMDIYAFVNGQFKAYQSFEISNSNDLNYFVLTFCQAFYISLPVQKIVVSGIELEHTYALSLKQFTKQITLISEQAYWKVDDVEVGRSLTEYQGTLDFVLCV